MPKAKKPKTHFEQVPLEIVKEIAQEDVQEEETDQRDAPAKPPAKKRGTFRTFK